MNPDKHAARRRDILIQSGTIMYGQMWLDPMAVAMGRSRKTIHRWSIGQTAMPDDIEVRLLVLLRGHRAQITALVDRIASQVREGRSGAAVERLGAQ